MASLMEDYLENTDFHKIQEVLDRSGKIIITTHTNPDGDAIGASLAMYRYLNKRGFCARVIIPDLYPEFLAWLPGSREIMIFDQDTDACKAMIRESDLIICVDFNNLSRLNELGGFIRSSGTAKILIDHHLYPSGEFILKISFSKISSTSEMIFDFISKSGYKHLLDKETAECLYTGIATDTGSFSYACNYVKTYLITAGGSQTVQLQGGRH
ncbi:MAG: DHH family phosphoesterase [Bacteroidetes bacterium]|nr:DHH family phosphoesterase [Bacteroidota bacterium]